MRAIFSVMNHAPSLRDFSYELDSLLCRVSELAVFEMDNPPSLIVMHKSQLAFSLSIMNQNKTDHIFQQIPLQFGDMKISINNRKTKIIGCCPFISCCPLFQQIPLQFGT